MLTADLALSWRRGRQTGPRYIDANDTSHVRVAEDLIYIFGENIGQRRGDLEKALDEYVGVGTDYKILRGLIKLLTDRCTFEVSSVGEPPAIREILFRKARLHHPVTMTSAARMQIIQETAGELNCSPEALIESLYADLGENQRLVAFDDLTAKQLLDRYNLAQAQALLYRCVEMNLKVEPQPTAAYRQLFDAIKNYRLIHTIKGNAATGYLIKLNGPVSIFHRSQKYGIQMAVFLPALLACKGWSMQAQISMKASDSALFELTSNDSRLRSDYFIEAASEKPFAEKLAANWADQNGAWRLEPSRQVIDLGESAFIPDFVIRGQDDEEIYLEILGFWTPRYLAERLKEFERLRMTNFILAVSEELRGSRDAPAKLPPNVVQFKTSLDYKAIKAALERLKQG